MRHTRADGKHVIDALQVLGRSLGYEVEAEARIAGTAEVDVAWFAAGHSDVPLFVFEVESTASSGLASNPMKVFGTPLDDLFRPLFFFHIVLKGSVTNDRIDNAERTWGSHNYRVYRHHDPIDRRRLIMDVIRQHRRTSSAFEPAAIAQALDHPAWVGVSVPTVLRESEELLFQANYTGDFALMALHDRRYLDLLADRLVALEQRDPTRVHASASDSFYGGWGDYIDGPIATSLQVHVGLIRDEDGPTALERWATSPEIGIRVIDASFRQSRDYDYFVLCIAPLHYAIAYALLPLGSDSSRWLIADLDALLTKEAARGISPEWRAAGALWLAHMAASALCTGPTRDDALNAIFENAQRHVLDVGTVPTSVFCAPPQLRTAEYDDQHWLDAEGPRSTLPNFKQLSEFVFAGGQVDDFHPHHAEELAVGALLDRYESWQHSSIVALLYSSSR